MIQRGAARFATRFGYPKPWKQCITSCATSALTNPSDGGGSARHTFGAKATVHDTAGPGCALVIPSVSPAARGFAHAQASLFRTSSISGDGILFPTFPLISMTYRSTLARNVSSAAASRESSSPAGGAPPVEAVSFTLTACCWSAVSSCQWLSVQRTGPLADIGSSEWLAV